MNERSALARAQHQFLKRVAELKLCTDVSLEAHLASLGERVERSLIVHMRAGRRPAPLGLLPLLLDHVDDRAAVLNILAEPHGLQVVPAGDLAHDDRGLADRTLELGDQVGNVLGSARRALADGVLDEQERGEIHRQAVEVQRSAAELAALTAPARRRSA